MSGPQDEATASASVHRSRWWRFSPSMGWKAFWSEIVIVVLGVVIALAANEAVQDWGWRNKVEDAETRLQGDLSWAFLWAAEKSASQPCVDAQLEALGRTVLESGETLKPAPVLTNLNREFVVRMPNRPYRFPVWDALLADGTATRFTPQRQAFLGRVSDSMARARLDETDTHRLVGSLLVMREPIALDPGVRADLLTRINELRSLGMRDALGAEQDMRMITDAGSAPPDDEVEAFLNASGRHPSGARFSGMTQFCISQGLPIADWRDYRKITVFSSLPPGAKVAR